MNFETGVVFEVVNGLLCFPLCKMNRHRKDGHCNLGAIQIELCIQIGVILDQ
jgi:hypothetical protein